MSQKNSKHRTPAELAELPDEALITDDEFCSVVNYSRTKLWRDRKDGLIPAHIKFGARMNRTPMGVARQIASPRCLKKQSPIRGESDRAFLLTVCRRQGK
jgi:hypothetical protein